MPINIRNADHLNLPAEQAASAISQSSEPPSASAQKLQARVNQEIKNAAQNLDQILGASNFTTETNGTTTTINFGDGINGAKPPTNATGEAGYRTGSGNTGNDATPGGTQESHLAGILQSELGVSGQSAEQLADAIAHGGQAGTEVALTLAETIANQQSSDTDQANQTGPQDPAAAPAPTRSDDLASLFENEKLRHLKP
jgi:hypothetical protein